MGGAQLADAVVGTRARRLTDGPIRLPRADRFTRLRPTCAAGKSFITGVTIRVVGGWVVKRVVLAFLTVGLDRKSTRLNSSHRCISYAVFCLKKKRNEV